MAQFKRLERGTLPDNIVADLRRRIASNELPVGEKLPNELELAKAYGVGRGTVREAIKALTLMRLLERNTTGTYVASGAQIHAPEELLASINSQDPDFESLYETRILLERHILHLACERATTSDMTSIEEALARAEQASSSVDALKADLDYHDALAEAAHSPVLKYLYMVTTDAIARAYRTFLPMAEPRSPHWGPGNHRRIVEAIKNRDSALAQRIAEDSLTRAAETVKGILNEPHD